MRISRREVIGAAAVGLLGPFEQGAAANPLGLPIGSQVFPHRKRIRDGDFAGLCRDLAAIGIGSLELCSPTNRDFMPLADAKQVKTIIRDHGLICPSAHCDMRSLRTRQQEMIDWAKEIGMTQMATATLSGPTQNGVATMDAVKRAADEYNNIALIASKAGLQQVLHDERFEMATIEGDGGLVYKALLKLLDPNLVKMQFQMTSMRVVGDPITYFNEYPGRFISMHLQGVDLNAPAPRAETPPNVPLGKGNLDWAAIFAAARTGGLRNYFIEQDWPTTVESVAFLKTLNV